VDDLGGARMQPITGGTIRGPLVAVQILEFGTADEIDSGPGYRAPEGATLIAFRTKSTADREAPDGIVANVSVDGKQRTLPNLFGISSTDTAAAASYIVAVPDQRRTVDFELKSPGLVQQFDLLEGKPKGDRPAALYRPAEGTVIKQEGLTPGTFEIGVQPGDFSPKQTITVTKAQFSYFNVQTNSVPSGPDKAWLTLSGSSATDKSASGGVNCIAPAAAYKLVDDKGSAIPPSDAGSTLPGARIIAEEDFVLSYEVPADFKHGTLSAAPTQVSCQVSTSNYQPKPARGEAKVDVTIPEK
jgi:hypothetical protein